MTAWKYLKLEIGTSSFKYFRTVKQKNQIGSFTFWENLRRANLLTVLSDLYTNLILYNPIEFLTETCPSTT